MPSGFGCWWDWPPPCLPLCSPSESPLSMCPSRARQGKEEKNAVFRNRYWVLVTGYSVQVRATWSKRSTPASDRKWRAGASKESVPGAGQAKKSSRNAKKAEWSGAGSNRRHMDFQSIALPTELPDQIPLFQKCRSYRILLSSVNCGHPEICSLVGNRQTRTGYGGCAGCPKRWAQIRPENRRLS